MQEDSFIFSLGIDHELVGPDCHYLSMNQVKAASTKAGQTATLYTNDLTGCQATVIAATLEQDKVALLSHVSPRHYMQTPAERLSHDRFDMAEEIKACIKSQPLLQDERAKKAVVVYHHVSRTPHMPSLHELKESFGVPFREEDVRLIPYRVEEYNRKAVHVNLPAEVDAPIVSTFRNGDFSLHGPREYLLAGSATSDSGQSSFQQPYRALGFAERYPPFRF